MGHQVQKVSQWHLYFALLMFMGNRNDRQTNKQKKLFEEYSYASSIVDYFFWVGNFHMSNTQIEYDKWLFPITISTMELNVIRMEQSLPWGNGYHITEPLSLDIHKNYNARQ